MKFTRKIIIGLISLGLVLGVIIVLILGPAELSRTSPAQQKSNGLNEGVNTSDEMNSTTGSQVSTIAAGQTPSLVPVAPFITINPVGNKNTGDLIIVNGTTSLPSRTSIYLKEINQSTGESTMIANTIACPDTRGVNRWSFALDSTAWMKPGKYWYTVTTPDGHVNTSVNFTLNGAFLGPENILYYQDSKASTLRGTGTPSITVNPIGDRQKGDVFLISGTTNLVEGTVLDCTVWPNYYEDPSKKPENRSLNPCEGQFNLIGYSTLVVKGPGDTNRWSFPADMTLFPENTTMIVHVSTTNADFTEKGYYGNATFHLA